MNDELDEVDGEGPGADGYPVTFIVSHVTCYKLDVPDGRYL